MTKEEEIDRDTGLLQNHVAPEQNNLINPYIYTRNCLRQNQTIGPASQYLSTHTGRNSPWLQAKRSFFSPT